MAAICTIKVGRVQSATSLHINDYAMEIDNHADTTVLGSNCLSIQNFGRSVDVAGWDASAGSIECPTIYGFIAYDNPISGKVYMLIYHQAIHCPRLTSHLMYPMQIRMVGVRINELSKFLAEDPDEKTHTIIVGTPLNPNEPLVIPLALKGDTSYLSSRKPRESEYEDELIPHIDMKSEAPVWEPSETSFAEQEDSMTDIRGEVIINETITRGKRMINYFSTREYHAEDSTDDDNFYKSLNAMVNVAKVGCLKEDTELPWITCLRSG